MLSHGRHPIGLLLQTEAQIRLLGMGVVAILLIQKYRTRCNIIYAMCARLLLWWVFARLFKSLPFARGEMVERLAESVEAIDRDVPVGCKRPRLNEVLLHPI